MGGINNDQAIRWIQMLQDNLAEFRKRSRLSPETKIKFISEQYARLFLIVRAINGRVIFTGTTPIGETKDVQP
jgi:hypothetical protein